MNSDKTNLERLRADICDIGKMRQVRVLVVDDDAGARMLIRDLLSKYEVAVMESDSGSNALEALSLVKYDVVLLDVKMPGMDGITTHREIKAQWPSVKVILCTGYTEWPGLQNALEDGCLQVISKSFLEKSLAEIFEPLCAKKLPIT